jgi:hypothetical protein
MKHQQDPSGPRDGAQNEQRHADPTPQSFADGFKMYAGGIRRNLTRLYHRQDHPELPSLDHRHRGEIQRWTESARQHLKECPPFTEIPGPAADNNWYAALTRLAEYCEYAAAVLEGAGGQGREKPWDESRAGFIPLKLVHQRYCTSWMAPQLSWLSKQCKPDGPFDFMRKKGVGVRGDEQQFAAWASEKGYTKEAEQKTEALLEVHQDSPAGVRDQFQIHEKYDMKWKKIYDDERKK